ncbi:hypothetical protein ACFCX4_28350 [Kitasatospora sp. NPDC056327]|uniref:hypothetical protein n=1 Tax=Kitasatospora sp. NPDC056327 TaxID=3345785 RepID=UPI0035D535AB
MKRLRTATVLAGLMLSLAGTAAAHADADGVRSTRPIDISTNYAWARGEVFWNSSTSTVYLQVHDTPQYTSNSWARIAYKTADGGQHYLNDFITVGNGGTSDRSYDFGFPAKDVWVDLCSKRNGATTCTGWK